MARPRRAISADGYLTCTRCKQAVFIGDFYCNNGTWFLLGDMVYGKPMSWCKQCTKDQRKEAQDAVVTDEIRQEMEYIRDLEEQLFIDTYGPPPPGFGSTSEGQG